MTKVSSDPVMASPGSFASGSVQGDPEHELSPISHDRPLTRPKQRDGQVQGNLQQAQPKHEMAVSSPPQLDLHARSRFGQGHSHDSWMQSQGRSNLAPRGGEGTSLPSRPAAQLGSFQQRNYTAPSISQRGPRVDSSTAVAASPPRGSGGGGGGNWNGGRNGKGRGGGRPYGQSRYEAGYHSQPADFSHDHQQPWKDPSWRRQPNEPPATHECRNENRNGSFAYRPCHCARCNERNRSVWVTVHERNEIHPADVGARLRHGMGGRFGEVEAVFPTPSYDGLGFIVRFRNESSVPMALEFASGLIPERQLSLNISAVHGSKWVNSTWQFPVPMAPDQGRMPPVNPGAAVAAGGYPVLNMYGMHPIPDHSAQASPMYPVFHGPVSPPVGMPAALPMGYNNNHGSTSPVMMAPPPVACRPYHDDGHNYNPTVPASISPITILKPDKGEDTKAVVDEVAQTKPPSEEALGGNVVAAKPCSPLKKTHEARVSLPTLSPKKVVKEVEKEEAPPCTVQVPDAIVDDVGKEAATTMDVKEANVGEVKDEGVKAKEAKVEETKVEETKVGEAKVEASQAEESKAGESKLADNNKQKNTKHATDQQKESTVVEDKTTTKAGKDVEVQPKEEKQRVPSIFTEEQIEDRRRAWDRIPMPLNPQKARKPAVESTSKPTASKTEQKPASDAIKAGSDGGASSVKEAPTTDKGTTRRQDGNAQTVGPRHERGQSQESTTTIGRDTAKKSRRKKNKSSRGTLPTMWGPQAGEGSQQQTPSTPKADEKRPKSSMSTTTTGSPSTSVHGAAAEEGRARDKTPSRARQAYRADAGGSLRQEKKRRGRAPAVDDFDSSSNGTMTPSSSSSSSSLTLLTPLQRLLQQQQEQRRDLESPAGINSSSMEEEAP
ncbi:hypothetical protein CP532_1129 [Ophiocordyceps camponoti-leonardi (nom. inval.)]|nr:hypothetical protein CP532_1129 [Ophiocordyceps camponoti-leonardi (nom. inval.)]